MTTKRNSPYFSDWAAMGLSPVKAKPAVTAELQKQRDRKNATYHRSVAVRSAGAPS